MGSNTTCNVGFPTLSHTGFTLPLPTLLQGGSFATTRKNTTPSSRARRQPDDRSLQVGTTVPCKSGKYRPSSRARRQPFPVPTTVPYKSGKYHRRPSKRARNGAKSFIAPMNALSLTNFSPTTSSTVFPQMPVYLF